MKRLLILLFCITLKLSAFATDWFEYYIYIQKTYSQGTWSRTNIFKNANYEYLHPILYSELFSISENEVQAANAIFNHLKKENPNRYNFNCTISIKENIITFKTNEIINEFEAVKNELTASYILNNYKAVRIIQKGKMHEYQLVDLSIPYMDIILPKDYKKENYEEQIKPIQDTLAIIRATQTTIPKLNNSITIGLIVSILLNLVLFSFLLKTKKT